MPSSAGTTQRFGAHLSIAGGLHLAFERAVAVGCDCLQIFVKNQKQWTGKPLTDTDVSLFRRAQRASGIKPVVAHASYLINLGSPDPTMWERSVSAVVDELSRCEALGVGGLVMHPGAHMGEGEEAGIARIADGLDEVHRRLAGIKARVLLECTAGQGSAIGWRIEHLGAILQRVGGPERVGVCLDTCHLFAAGYDLRDADAYERMVADLKRHVTLQRIACLHVNDSKCPLGGRVDRHAHIGEGQIGNAGFRRMLQDRRFLRVPRILETAKGTDAAGVDLDVINLRRLRRLIRSGPAGGKKASAEQTD